MNTILLLIDAVKAGNELKNAEAWKKKQSATALVMAILAAAVAVGGVFGFRPDLDPDLLQSLAGGVVACFGLFNGYLSLATSSRVGLGSKDMQAQAEPESARGSVNAGSNASSANGSSTPVQLPIDNGL